MTENVLTELLRNIRRAPSVEAWQTILAYAVEGRFNELLERLGGIEGLVDSAIVNASDPTAAKLALNAALENFTAVWQPFLPLSYSAAERILRLISSRTPPSGFVRVLGQLSDRGGFSLSGEITPRESKYIDDLALSALRSYFPGTPADPSAFPAFDSYIALLWRRLDADGYRGHACQRLIELGRLGVDDRRMEPLLKKFSEETIPPLLSWLLNTRAPERDHLLSHLFLTARAHPLVDDVFRTSVARQGASLEETIGSVCIVLRSGESIDLWVEMEDVLMQDQLLSDSMEEWETAPAQGRAAIEALIFQGR